MIVAELSHNPYLLETDVLFNGRSPRVNSSIKKYEHRPLVEWYREVPRIFRDEMNGYDFDLHFTGTDSDFERIVQAFNEEGTSKDAVRIIRKGKLKSPEEKKDGSLELLNWLKECPNRRFNFYEFVGRNAGLSDTSFPLVFLYGQSSGEMPASVSIEIAASVNELSTLDLADTPIVISITPETVRRINDDIGVLVSRDDVSSKQLFFAMHPLINKDQVIRLLKDLGIENVQVVSSIEDEAISAFLRDYQVTDYVRTIIDTTSDEAARILSELEADRLESEQSSVIERGKIEECEQVIARLKKTEEELLGEGLSVDEQVFEEYRKSFYEHISRWKSKKRTIEGDPEAVAAAEDYERIIRYYLNGFISRIDEAANDQRRSIEDELSRVYRSASVDCDFTPEEIELQLTVQYTFPNVKSAMLAFAETIAVAKKADIFDVFYRKEPDQTELMMITMYNLDSWRDKASKLISPIIDSMVETRIHALRSYRQRLGETYLAHVVDLIEEKQALKDSMVDDLSDEEKILQEDSDWLGSLNDKLNDIKRG